MNYIQLEIVDLKYPVLEIVKSLLWLYFFYLQIFCYRLKIKFLCPNFSQHTGICTLLTRSHFTLNALSFCKESYQSMFMLAAITNQLQLFIKLQQSTLFSSLYFISRCTFSIFHNSCFVFINQNYSSNRIGDETLPFVDVPRGYHKHSTKLY